MSKRSFTFLTIVLIILIISIFGFLYFKNGTIDISEDDGFGTNFISQFNPFGGNTETSPDTTPTYDISEENEPLEETEEVEKKLVKVSSMPVAGFTVFTKERYKDIQPEIILPNENTLNILEEKTKTTSTKTAPPETEFVPALRYVDRATGNIYQTFADKIEERRFSKTTIPKVHEAYFGNKGESVIMRYLETDEKTIKTFVGTLPKELLGEDSTEDNEAKGSFLPDNITDISLSPDNSKIFYLFETTGNSSQKSIVGTTLDLKNNKKVQIFDSPFTEWLSSWSNNNLITLTTKPSVNIPGHIYTINSLGKNFGRILGDIDGLTTLGNPNGKMLLYNNDNLSLYIYNTESKNSNLLGIRTLPEKCVWSKIGDVIYCAVPKSISSGGYPDSWYQGEVSFNDQIWKIDVKTRNATMLLDPFSVVYEDIDGIKMALSDNEDYLFFVNKKDSFLWKLNLK